MNPIAVEAVFIKILAQGCNANLCFYILFYMILAVTKPEIIAEQIIANWFINIGVDLYSNKLSITYICAIC
mgnify:CR=1 FL=1